MLFVTFIGCGVQTIHFKPVSIEALKKNLLNAISTNVYFLGISWPVRVCYAPFVQGFNKCFEVGCCQRNVYALVCGNALLDYGDEMQFPLRPH